MALLERPDVDYLSVKVSSVAAQLNLWSYRQTLARTKDALRVTLRAAASASPSAFVNLDMEEYRDLSLTLDTFTQLLDEPEFLTLEAGVVLQAYLPDSLDALERLAGWAAVRRDRGGAVVKVRIVKGANLAAERVDAAMHGWPLAPFGTKAGTDANHKAMLEYALRPEHVGALAVGVAGHNVFDLAWAHLLAEARGVQSSVTFELLQGMAPATARAVRDATGRVLLYTPVVAPADFDHALAYLFRRLEENAGGENFIAALADPDDAEAFARRTGPLRGGRGPAQRGARDRRAAPPGRRGAAPARHAAFRQRARHGSHRLGRPPSVDLRARARTGPVPSPVSSTGPASTASCARPRGRGALGRGAAGRAGTRARALCRRAVGAAAGVGGAYGPRGR